MSDAAQHDQEAPGKPGNDALWTSSANDEGELERLWPMLRKALGYILEKGPSTQQDRWEEVGGYSPYTIATEIAALLEAAEFTLEPELADTLRETADAWNQKIEQWTYATGTELAGKFGVEGYYVRISPDTKDDTSPVEGSIELKNMKDTTCVPAASIVSVDALALVRFGLRAADDPRILNTVRVIDSLLKVDTPSGPCWHRYNRDGYGEHADGSLSMAPESGAPGHCLPGNARITKSRRAASPKRAGCCVRWRLSPARAA